MNLNGDWAYNGMNEVTVKRLYEQYGFYIYRRCRRLLRSEMDAEDALHEVFVRLLKNHDDLREKGSLLPWLNRVTTNYCLNQIRRKKIRNFDAKTEVDTLPDDDVGLFTRFLENQQMVAWLIAHSDEETREIAVGYFLDEKSVQSLAESMQVSVPTIRRRIKTFVTDARMKLSRQESFHPDPSADEVKGLS